MIKDNGVNIKVWQELIVDKDSPIPAYYQIKEYIKGLLDQRLIGAHVKVPAERELCSVLFVSRMTVRQALTELVKEGYLYRQKGRGTFVAEPKITHPMMSLVSFSEDMHVRGMKAGGKTLKKTHMICNRNDIKEALNLKDGEMVLAIEMLRFADNCPMVLERSYFPYNHFAMLEEEDLDSNSLYDILQNKYGVVPKRSRERIEAGLANDYLAELLNTEKGAPLLVVTGISTDDHDIPIEYVQSYYRGDRYQFLVELER